MQCNSFWQKFFVVNFYAIHVTRACSRKKYIFVYYLWMSIPLIKQKTTETKNSVHTCKKLFFFLRKKYSEGRYHLKISSSRGFLHIYLTTLLKYLFGFQWKLYVSIDTRKQKETIFLYVESEWQKLIFFSKIVVKC